MLSKTFSSHKHEHISIPSFPIKVGSNFIMEQVLYFDQLDKP